MAAGAILSQIDQDAIAAYFGRHRDTDHMDAGATALHKRMEEERRVLRDTLFRVVRAEATGVLAYLADTDADAGALVSAADRGSGGGGRASLQMEGEGEDGFDLAFRALEEWCDLTSGRETLALVEAHIRAQRWGLALKLVLDADKAIEHHPSKPSWGLGAQDMACLRHGIMAELGMDDVVHMDKDTKIAGLVPAPLPL
jgi:hypothetical protein